VAGVVVRFAGMGARSLWLDEAMSWRLMEFPFVEMLQRGLMPEEKNPPLYYVLLRGWVGLWGDSEVALRSLAGLLGALTIPGVYLVVWELRSFARQPLASASEARWRSVALLAAALFSLNGFQIHLGQQARGYTLAIFLVVYSSMFLLRALRMGDRLAKWSWLTYAALALALCYTHNVGLFSVVSQLFFAGLYRWRSLFAGRFPRRGPTAAATSPWRFSWFPLALGGFAAGYLPWVLHLTNQVHTQTDPTGGNPHLEWLPTEWLVALIGTFDSPRIYPFGAALVLFLAFLGIQVVNIRLLGWAGAYVFLCSVLPLYLLAFLAINSNHKLIFARYFAFAQVWWLVAFALLGTSWPWRWVRTGFATLQLGVALCCLWNHWPEIGPRANLGLRGATQHILGHKRDDELIVARTPFVLFSLAYYSRGQDSPLLVVPPALLNGSYFPGFLRVTEMIAPEEVLNAHPGGIWFITSPSYGNQEGTRVDVPPEWNLVEQLEFEQDYRIERPLTVTHYRLKGLQ
jgi:hypothetical protein